MRLRGAVAALAFVLATTGVGATGGYGAAALPQAEAGSRAAPPDVRLAARSAPSCGRRQFTKPDGTPWVCTFAEEFDGKRLNRKRWQKVVTRTSGTECFRGGKANVKVAKGKLRLTARKLRKRIRCASPHGNFRTRYTSGSITTHGLFSQTYGRFQVRAKFPKSKVRGLQSAIWMTPQTPIYGAWPRSGEIDIVEHYTRHHRRAIPYLHYMFGFPATPNTSQTNNHCKLRKPAKFHTYVLLWEPGRIRVSIDGRRCLDHRVDPMSSWQSPQPFDHPFVFNLTHLLGVKTNKFSAKRTELPSTFVVDHWRAWR